MCVCVCVHVLSHFSHVQLFHRARRFKTTRNMPNNKCIDQYKIDLIKSQNFTEVCKESEEDLN